MNKEPIEVHTDRAKTSDDRASETHNLGKHSQGNVNVELT